jgi:hypothetical protein
MSIKISKFILRHKYHDLTIKLVIQYWQREIGIIKKMEELQVCTLNMSEG